VTAVAEESCYSLDVQAVAVHYVATLQGEEKHQITATSRLLPRPARQAYAIAVACDHSESQPLSIVAAPLW